MKDLKRLFTVSTALVFSLLTCSPRTLGQAASGDLATGKIQTLKITVLSTMLVGEPAGIGEWGFAALVEANGHRVLVDTGAHPETVLRNARELKIDLSDVHEVILTHNHDDHVSGLMALRRELMKRDRRGDVGCTRGQGNFLQPSYSSRRGQRDDRDAKRV